MGRVPVDLFVDSALGGGRELGYDRGMGSGGGGQYIQESNDWESKLVPHIIRPGPNNGAYEQLRGKFERFIVTLYKKSLLCQVQSVLVWHKSPGLLW